MCIIQHMVIWVSNRYEGFALLLSNVYQAIFLYIFPSVWLKPISNDHGSVTSIHYETSVILSKSFHPSFASMLYFLFKNKNAGFLRQPKWGHLRDLHQAIKLCEEYIVNSVPTYMHMGKNLEVLFREMFTFFGKLLSLRKGLWIDFYFLKTMFA